MSFSSLGLPQYLLQAVEKAGYVTPTPIQALAIPEVFKGADIIAEAQTGTGKTAAFALPIIQVINELPPKKKKVSVLSLVLVPTRELALQVADSFKVYREFSPRKITVVPLIGGEPISDQITKLRHGADIAVATPGRLLELIDKKEIRLFELEVLVLDEGDKMLDLGFADELDAVLEKLPKKRQNLLLSATFPKKVAHLAAKFLTDPVHLKLKAAKPTVENISQRVIEVNRVNRGPLLRDLIEKENWAHVLVFVASQRAARNLSLKLQKYGVKADAFHGGLMQDERIDALEDFKTKKTKVLVATDIAARGIDIDKLSHVVNYDLPRSPAEYIHRIGRTGRAGEEGIAVSFIGHEDQSHFKLIEKRANISLDRESVAGFELTGEAPKKVKGAAPVKGKRMSKKDKARAAASALDEASN